MLWGQLRNKQMMGYDFDRQKPVDNYILDFFCHELMLGIELDGITHDFEDVVARDIMKEKRLNELGITILRFTDREVYDNIHGVVLAIEMFIENVERGRPHMQ
jgi:very-short-patch-repair endonuclease